MPVDLLKGAPAPNVGQRIVRQDSLLVAKTIHYDDANLERNKQLRNSGFIDKAKLNLHDDADLRMVISCPDTLQWTRFKKKYPDIYKGLLSRDEEARMKACRQLQILHPAWVIQERL